MIDTLNFSYEYKDGCMTTKEEMVKNLEKVTKIYYPNGASSFSAKFKDYKISVGDSRLKLTGSITKQVFGNNFQTLSRPQLIDGIGELSEHLNFDVSRCKVHRIDVSTNWKMDHSPPAYFDSLGQDYYGNWTRQPSFTNRASLYWNINGTKVSREKLCYDKTVWAKDKGIKIPKEFKDLNLFRYENRLMSTNVVSTIIDKVKPLVKHLFEKDIYILLIKEWKHQWDTIEKIKKLNFKLKPMKESEMQQLIIARCIDAIGEEEYGNLIQQMKAFKVFKFPSQYTRFRKNINRIREKNSVIDNPLLEELEIKIGDVEVYYS